MGLIHFVLAVGILGREDQAAPQTLEDLKVGDCLTFEDMQGLVGVYSKDVYLAGDGNCKAEYALSAPVFQNGICDGDVSIGSWTRQTNEHSKWGIYFPSSAPCFESVSRADFSAQWLERIIPVGEEETLPACVPEDFQVQKFQIESLVTKRWSVGQGAMYLPNPLKVHREDYGVDPELGYQLNGCFDRQLLVTYRGWGAFESTWQESSCLGEPTPTNCRVARMEASENDKGETCIEVTRIKDCN